jgi:glycosyltransferase involved in cell wall biosynthesis
MVSDTPTLSVVMVTLNEESAITKVVGDIKQAAPNAEILVVDSSTDSTAEIAENLGCRVIKQIPARGYGPAMHTALSEARGETVITMDCDDTYPAEFIPLLVARISQGFDLVSASRMERKPKAMSFANYFANCTFAFLACLLCGVRTTDVHTGMRAYRKSMLTSFHYDPDGMALPVELLVGPAQQGYKCTEIFIDYRPRIGETTLKRLEGTIWTLRRLWKLRRFLRCGTRV